MPAAIVAVATSKGGAGKTLLLQTLVPNLAAFGYKVAVIDADPNRAFTEWAELYGDERPFKLLTEASEKVFSVKAAGLAEEHDIVFIDTPGFGNQGMMVAMSISDAVIIPSQPGRKNIIEAKNTLDYIPMLEVARKRPLPAVVLMTKIDKRRKTDQFATKQVEEIQLPTFETVLSDRDAYNKVTWDPDIAIQGIMGQEANMLIEEIQRIGWLPEKPQAGADHG